MNNTAENSTIATRKLSIYIICGIAFGVFAVLAVIIALLYVYSVGPKRSQDNDNVQYDLVEYRSNAHSWE